MALDFPSSPTNGQTFNNYTYDSTIGAWRSASVTTVGVPSGGSAGQVLAKASANSYDTTWNSVPTSPNYIINGALDYWQRSTSAPQALNTSGYPSADRYKIISSGASAVALTLAQSTDVPSGVGVQYSAALSWSSNISGGDHMVMQSIENGKYLFAGKTITVSFYAKAATAITAKFDFDQDYSETYFNLTTSWQRFSYTVTLPSTYQSSRPTGAATNDNTELRFIRFTSVSSASNTVYFTGVQVEEGPAASPFRRSAPSLQAELAACQRYYEKSYDVGVAPGTASNVGMVYGSQNVGAVTTGYIGGQIIYKVTKRVPPTTVTCYDALGASGKCQRFILGSTTTQGQTVYADTGSGNTNVTLVYSSGTASAAGIGFQYTAEAEL
jgi:hypothetical protein